VQQWCGQVTDVSFRADQDGKHGKRGYCDVHLEPLPFPAIDVSVEKPAAPSPYFPALNRRLKDVVVRFGLCRGGLVCVFRQLARVAVVCASSIHRGAPGVVGQFRKL